jgi:tetratricopeptide (TPR) repeat protein
LAIAALDTVRLEEMLNRGEIEEAQKFVAQSLRADGFKASAASVDNVIGWAYFSFSNTAQAELHLMSALHKAEKQGDRQIAILAANNLGIVNFTENRLDRAEFYFGMEYNADTEVAREYRRLIDAKRREITLSMALERGKQQRYEGKFQQAVSSYETVLKLDPRNAAALEYKGYALYRLGRMDEAEASLEAARSIDPSQYCEGPMCEKVGRGGATSDGAFEPSNEAVC